MPKFCPGCGTKLSNEASNFCSECGIKISDGVIQKVAESEKTNAPIFIEETSKEKSHIGILIGIGIIVALYLIPIATIGNNNLAIADLNSLCNSNVGQLAQLLMQTNCDTYNVVFVGGWIIGIVIIILGIRGT
jgi:hypothetical protein